MQFFVSSKFLADPCKRGLGLHSFGGLDYCYSVSAHLRFSSKFLSNLNMFEFFMTVGESFVSLGPA